MTDKPENYLEKELRKSKCLNLKSGQSLLDRLNEANIRRRKQNV
jgi:hypothetical protein